MNEQKIDSIRRRRFPMGVCDIVVLAAAIVLTVVSVLTLRGNAGSSVEISYEGTVLWLPLGENATRRVGDHLTVVIENGKCYVTDSDCKNRTCERTGKIGRVGESIVCAQNRIVITVVGDDGLAGSVGRG
ncbi:MAG: NusG domain II-containing protein [Clostridia bacterium]|nr:NusG domain II-containing protein [Clostridia bacterium]